MILFEEILEEIVGQMSPVAINSSLSRNPMFYWGTSEDLPQFLKVYRENHFPLIWSVSKPDTKEKSGYSRNAELILATRETREDLLNTDRIKENYSFKKVLYPLWKSLENAIDLSQNIEIEEDGLTFIKVPNYSEGGEYATQEIWDVLKVDFASRFYENHNC